MHDLLATDSPLTSPEVGTPATVYVSPSLSPLGQRKGFDRETRSERCDSVMDYYDPSRRRYAQDPYTAAQEPQQQHYVAEPTTDQFTAPASGHRFRQTTTLEEIPDGIPSTATSEHDPQLYSFAQGQPFGLVSAPNAQTLRYSTEMQTPENQRAPDPSQYTPYSTTPMYSMEQGLSQQQSSQLQYDQTRYRMPAPGETVAHEPRVPQASHYYIAGQASPSAASTSDFKYPQMSPPHHRRSTAYGHAGPSAPQHQAGPIFDTSTPAVFPDYPQEATGQAHGPTADSQGLVTHIHALVRSIFSHVHSRSLHEIGGMLLDLSYQLLSHVQEIGLLVDNELHYGERLQLWNLYNNAWLSTLQAQHDMTQEMIHTQQPRPVIPLQELERLGSELVRLCDGVERYGLVDYEMGVAEEEIMDLLLKCIALLEPAETQDPGHDIGMAESSASGAARAP